MKLNYFKKYWKTLEDTAMWNMSVTISHTDNRVIWQGTVGEFANLDRMSRMMSDDRWTVVYFGHPAVTEADEAIPEYNRPIWIQVI